MMKKQAMKIGENDKRDITSFDFESGRMKRQTVVSSRQIETAAQFNELKSQKGGTGSFKISQASINYLNPNFAKT